MFSLLIVNQANTLVLLTAFFILATWLEEKERERRMRWHVNLPDIPDHLEPVEHFFPHVIPRGAKKKLTKKTKHPFSGLPFTKKSTSFQIVTSPQKITKTKNKVQHTQATPPEIQKRTKSNCSGSISTMNLDLNLAQILPPKSSTALGSTKSTKSDLILAQI